MTNRRPIGANGPSGNAGCEDYLLRLVRVIAREAAQEALRALRDDPEVPPASTGSPDSSIHQPKRPKETARANDPWPEPGERLLSVAAVAERLGLSEKSVRRRIDRGELPAHKDGRLLRVSERDLAGYIARTRIGKGQDK